MKDNIKLFIYISFIVIALSSCSVLSPQSEAGLTRAEMKAQEFDKDGRVVKECSAVIHDGKQRTDVSLNGTICGSSFSYMTKEELSFQAFLIRGEVEKKSIEQLGKIVPEVVDAALRAFLGSTVIGGVGNAVAAKAALDAAQLKIDAIKAMK